MLNWCPLKIEVNSLVFCYCLRLLAILYIVIHENLLPVYSPSGITRASHSIQLIRPHARMNVYLNSFSPHTVLGINFHGVKILWISWGLCIHENIFACILTPAAHDRLSTFFRSLMAHVS